MIPLLYGLAVLVALTLTLAERRCPPILTAVALVLSWSASNIIVIGDGFAKAPLLLPMLDAILGVCVGIVALLYMNRVAAVVFGLFVLVGALHVYAYLQVMQGSYIYYTARNLLFLAQVLTVGGSAGYALVAHWARWRALRDGGHSYSR